MVPGFVTLHGNHTLYSGTTIRMPFLYKHGKQCGPQTPGIIANENDIECTDARMPANTISPNKYVFVFKMMEGSRLQNLCIEGPKTDTKEQFMVSLLDNINAH